MVPRLFPLLQDRCSIRPQQLSFVFAPPTNIDSVPRVFLISTDSSTENPAGDVRGRERALGAASSVEGVGRLAHTDRPRPGVNSPGGLPEAGWSEGVAQRHSGRND